jgi:hypothetical protein
MMMIHCFAAFINRGPSKMVFSAGNSSYTNVTELTKGEYEIQLTVTDDNQNSATDSVVVTVTQSKFPVIFCMDQVADIILLKKEAKAEA